MTTDIEKIKEKIEQRKQEDRKAVTEIPGGWWLPEKSDYIFQDKEGQFVPQPPEGDQEAVDEFIRYMLPKGLYINEHSEYENSGDLLLYDNLETGEEEYTPLRGNLLNKLATLHAVQADTLQKALEYKGDISNVEPDKMPVFLPCVIRYCGKLNSMKKEDSRKYHTFTGELLDEKDTVQNIGIDYNSIDNVPF